MYKLLLISFLFFSCSSESSVDDNGGGSDPNEKIVPSNLVFDVQLVGVNDENPYGDGSGTVKFSASATNA